MKATPASDVFLRPGLLAALGLISGHLLASAFGVGNALLGLALTILSVSVLIASKYRSLPFALGFCAFFIGLGFLQEARIVSADRGAAGALAEIAPAGSSIATAKGRVAAPPRRSAESWTVLLDDGSQLGVAGSEFEFPSLIAVRLRTGEATNAVVSQIVPGDEIRVTGALHELPLVTGRGEATGWLRSQGCLASIKATSIKRVGSDANRSGWQNFLAVAQRTAQSAEALIIKSLPEEEAAVLVAMTLGRTHHLSADQRERFRRSGVMHLFAVSGLHTMLVGGLLVFVLRLLGLRPVTRFVLLAVALTFFAALIGLKPSVLRAALLLLAFEGTYILRRPVEPLSLLGGIASLLMVLTPRVVWAVDFQLSFLCVLAIIMLAPWMYELQRLLGRRLGWSWPARVVIRSVQVVCISATIQLVLAPVLTHHFGEVSLIAPIGNLLLLALAALCIKICYICFFLALATPSAASVLMEWLLELPLRFMDHVAGWLSALPFAVWQGTSWPLLLTAAVYILIVGGPWFRFRSHRQPRRVVWQFVPAFGALFLIVAWLPFHTPASGSLDVWFLDVGQGDAILIRSPDGRAVLVDAGPDRMGPYLPDMLRERGVARLEAAIASHADADHIGALAETLEVIPCNRLIVSGLGASTTDFREVEEVVRDKGIDVFQARRGAEMILGSDGVSLTFLHPVEEFVTAGADRNESSVVLMLEYAERRILLTGDAEQRSEFSMMEAGYDLQSDVLKLGHHGSASSTNELFLARVSPTVAIASCGLHNRYGHPSTEVLARLAGRGVRLYRTDQDGTIHVRIDTDGSLHISATRRTE